MTSNRFGSLSGYREYSQNEMRQRAADFAAEMRKRRSVRAFSRKEVPMEIIEDCLRVAGSAPSGANRQPWHFVVVKDPEIKRRIRQEAEKVEHEFYHKRAGKDFLDALAPLGTGEQKPFIEDAPYLIVIFAQSHRIVPERGKVKHYYVNESVGIAAGMLITAIHHTGLACLPYTPSPMEFLNAVLKRPKNERPFLVLVTGYPAEGALVPKIRKKPLHEIATFL